MNDHDMRLFNIYGHPKQKEIILSNKRGSRYKNSPTVKSNNNN